MPEQTVLVNVSQMIDLAIGTPETGVVDFNMLQTVLHVFAQQQNILGKYVELSKGVTFQDSFDDAERATVVVEEISIRKMGESLGRRADGVKTGIYDDQHDDNDEDTDTLLRVERVPRTQLTPITEKELLQATLMSTKSPKSSMKKPPPFDPGSQKDQAPGSRTGDTDSNGNLPRAGADSKVENEEKREASEKGSFGSRKDGERRLSIVTAQQFLELEDKVGKLQEHVFGSTHKAEEMIQEVRSQSNVKAISEMWQSLNVSARLEATEAGLEKLSSLMQDLAQEYVKVQNQLKQADSDIKVAASKNLGDNDAQSPAQSEAVGEVQQLDESVDGAVSGKAKNQPSKSRENVEQLGKNIKMLQKELKTLQDAYKKLERQAGVKDDVLEPAILNDELPVNDNSERLSDEVSALRNQVGALSQSVDQLVQTKKGDAAGKTGKGDGGKSKSGDSTKSPGEILAISDRLRQLEKRVDKCCSKVSDVNSTMNKTSNEMKSLQGQISSTKISRLDSSNLQSIEASMPKEMAGLMELFSKVQELQKHISSLNQTARLLLEDREERQANINTLLEQVEVLKMCKVEREDVAMVMASKADEVALRGKVSLGTFELACDDLTRGLQGTVSKLATQETAWQQTLVGIQNEMENKLDKLEMSPVKEFIQSRLQQLQDGFKRLIDMRKEALAAGTKQKYLRNVNCLSCDTQVIQATAEGPVGPTTKPMPVTYSMKAYLSYELDAMRKQRQGPAMQRNLHDWEDIERDMKQRKKTAQTYVLRDAQGAHVCSRYCGGSHTVTGAQQRAAHTGPCSKQRFGPDVLNLSSGFGEDGKVYKVSAGGDEMKNETKCITDKPNATSIGTPIKNELPLSQVRRKSYVGECTC